MLSAHVRKVLGDDPWISEPRKSALELTFIATRHPICKPSYRFGRRRSSILPPIIAAICRGRMTDRNCSTDFNERITIVKIGWEAREGASLTTEQRRPLDLTEPRPFSLVAVQDQSNS